LSDKLEEPLVPTHGFDEFAAFGGFGAFLGNEVQPNLFECAGALGPDVSAVSGMVVTQCDIEAPKEAIFHALLASGGLDEASGGTHGTNSARGLTIRVTGRACPRAGARGDAW